MLSNGGAKIEHWGDPRVSLKMRGQIFRDTPTKLYPEQNLEYMDYSQSQKVWHIRSCQPVWHSALKQQRTKWNLCMKSSLTSTENKARLCKIVNTSEKNAPLSLSRMLECYMDWDLPYEFSVLQLSSKVYTQDGTKNSIRSSWLSLCNFLTRLFLFRPTTWAVKTPLK